MIRQSWEFDLSIFDLSIFWIFLKDRPWSNRSRRSLKKIESIESLPLIFEKDRKDRIALKKRAIPRWKKRIFYVFDRCSPFLCQIESIPTMRSLRWKNRWSNSQPCDSDTTCPLVNGFCRDIRVWTKMAVTSSQILMKDFLINQVCLNQYFGPANLWKSKTNINRLKRKIKDPLKMHAVSRANQ